MFIKFTSISADSQAIHFTYDIFFDAFEPTEQLIRKEFIFHVAGAVAANNIVY